MAVWRRLFWEIWSKKKLYYRYKLSLAEYF